MDEIIALDQNSRWGLAGVTNDSNQFILNARINPINNRLIVEGVVTSTNTSIGDVIPGLTEGSVLFGGVGGTLAQDNANFFWDDADGYLGLGTDTPSATLDIEGTFKYVDGNQTAGYVLTSDASGNATWQPAGTGTSGYNLIQNNGVSVTQETTINLSTLLTASDVGGKTALTINTTNLANDNTFVSTLASNNTFAADLVANNTFLSDLAGSTTFVNDLIANNTFTTNLANNSNFYTTLGNNTSFIGVLTSNTTFQGDVVTFVNSSGSLSVNLTSQVTGVLPIANGGTDSGTALSGSSIMISNGTAIVQGAKGTTTTVLHGNASGAPTYSAVDLANDITGTLLVPHGGTGDTSFTAYAPIFGGTTSTGALQSGTVGTAGQVLTSNGAGALPTFQNNPALMWTDEGTLTWSASNTNQTITLVNAGRDLYQIFLKFDSNSALIVQMQVNGDTGFHYTFTSLNGTTLTTTTNAGQFTLANSGSHELSGYITISGNSIGGIGGTGLPITGSMSVGNGDVLVNGEYGTSGAISLSTITFITSGSAATLNGKIHAYSMNL